MAEETRDAQGVGQALREAREAQGLSVEEVAKAMKLSNSTIRRLESEDWEGMQAPVYVRGYIRSYAHLVGLDEDALLSLYNVVDVRSANEPRIELTAVDGGQKGFRASWVFASAALALAVVVAVALLLVLPETEEGLVESDVAEVDEVAPAAVEVAPPVAVEVAPPAAEVAPAAVQQGDAAPTVPAIQAEPEAAAAQEAPSLAPPMQEAAAAGDEGAAVDDGSVAVDDGVAAAVDEAAADEGVVATDDEAAVADDGAVAAGDEAAVADDGAVTADNGAVAADDGVAAAAEPFAVVADQTEDAVQAGATEQEGALPQFGADQLAPAEALEEPPMEAVVVNRLTLSGDDEIELLFSDECWVEVKDLNGEFLYAHLGEPNDRVLLVGQGPFDVKLGYSPGVELRFNGVPVPLAPHTRDRVASLVLGR